MSLRGPEQSSILFRSILTAIAAILVVAVASAILSPLLPPAFQLTDFFSEISVLTFALIWIRIRSQISDRGDRHTITLGIIVFSIGALADILDEFGIGSTVRASIENFAFVGGFLLVSLGLRNWSEVSYKEREEIAKENAYLARHDALTGLRNRQALIELVDFAANRRSKMDHMFALIFVDLDHFKLVNDEYGHHVGDELLCGAAQRMRETVRSTDDCYRIGGDEFVVFLSELSNAEAATTVRKKLSARLSEAYEIDGQRVWSDASIGMSVFPLNGESIDELLRHADAEMYNAKSSKRTQSDQYA